MEGPENMGAWKRGETSVLRFYIPLLTLPPNLPIIPKLLFSSDRRVETEPVIRDN